MRPFLGEGGPKARRQGGLGRSLGPGTGLASPISAPARPPRPLFAPSTRAVNRRSWIRFGGLEGERRRHWPMALRAAGRGGAQGRAARRGAGVAAHAAPRKVNAFQDGWKKVRPPARRAPPPCGILQGSQPRRGGRRGRRGGPRRSLPRPQLPSRAPAFPYAPPPFPSPGRGAERSAAALQAEGPGLTGPGRPADVRPPRRSSSRRGTSWRSATTGPRGSTSSRSWRTTRC